MMYQAGIAKIDRRSHDVSVFPFPKEWISASAQASMVSPMHADVDGKVWTNNQEDHFNYRLDVATGRVENLGQAKSPGGQHIRRLGNASESPQQSVSVGFGGQEHGSARCETAGGYDLADFCAGVAPATGRRRRAEPPLVRAIWSQCNRHVRSADRDNQGV